MYPSTFFFFSFCYTAITLETKTLTYDESYYEYVPDRMQWSSAGKLCNQRSGALAAVSNPVENQELTSFLKSLNISQPVWIARKVTTHLTSRFRVPFLHFILTYSTHSSSVVRSLFFFHLLIKTVKEHKMGLMKLPYSTLSYSE